MNQDEQNRREELSRSDENGLNGRARDAARLSMLMGSEHASSGTEAGGASIPMPELEETREDVWNAQEAMTEEGYQRVRKGYERVINPDALERMEEHQGSVQQFPPPAPSYRESREQVAESEPEVAPQRIRIEPETQWQPTTRVRRGKIGPVAVTLILLVSITGGLLLYAGGAEYLGGLFGSGQAEPEENLTLITERPGAIGEAGSEQNQSAEFAVLSEVEEPDVPASAIEEQGVEEAEEAAQRAAREQAEAEEQARAQERALQEEEARRKKAEAEEAQRRQALEEKKRQEAARKEAEKKAAAVKAAVPETTGSGAWAVQVMATADKAEADRVARALRSKGGADVHVIVTDKSDGTLYRVRFGAFDSQSEAKKMAGALGYSDVWVVKK